MDNTSTHAPIVLNAALPSRLQFPAAPYGKFKAAPGTCQIKAENDIQAIGIWLAEFHDSPHTLSSYRKEAERLLLWAGSQPEPKAISGLMRDDFMRYEQFLANPYPEHQWVGPAVPRAHPDWRPFTWKKTASMPGRTQGDRVPTAAPAKRTGGLSAASQRQAMGVLCSLYGYLHKTGYLSVNPLASKTKKRQVREQRKQIHRFLSRETWEFLLDFIDRMPTTSRREQQHFYRVRWVFCLLYLSRARRSEIASARMSDMYRDDQNGLWYFRVFGKGRKERDIPVSDELLTELSAYRKFHGLTALPSPNDDKPLVLPVINTQGRPAGKDDPRLTPKAIYLIVKEICFRASEALKVTDPDQAVKLSMATTHWLRHTSATHFVNDGGDLRVAQETLGHTSITTTMIYQHTEKTDLHEKSSQQRLRVRTPFNGNSVKV